MKFEVRQVAAGPRNCVGEVYCDGVRIATVNCTIAELAEMRRRLELPPLGNLPH